MQPSFFKKSFLFMLGLSCWAPSWSLALCVSAYQTKLRRDPSLNSPVTWVVGRYMPFIEIERKSGWVKMRDVDGEIHWAMASEVTSQVRCVVVQVRMSALRKGPGSQYPLADIHTVDRYTAFKRIEAEPEDWYQVEDEAGGQYWIQAKHVWKPNKVNRIGF